MEEQFVQRFRSRKFLQEAIGRFLSQGPMPRTKCFELTRLGIQAVIKL